MVVRMDDEGIKTLEILSSMMQLPVKLLFLCVSFKVVRLGRVHVERFAQLYSYIETKQMQEIRQKPKKVFKE